MSPDSSTKTCEQEQTIYVYDATNACLCLLQMVAPHRPEHWDVLGEYSCSQRTVLATGHRPGRSVQDLNEPFTQGVWPLLEEIDVEADLDQTRRLFYELRVSTTRAWQLRCSMPNLGWSVRE